MGKKKDRYEFIWDAIQKHGYKYDYRKVEYKKAIEKICIICSEHGEFWQTPHSHLQGRGCQKCAINFKSEKRRHTNEQFIEKAKDVHGDRYNYSKVEYINNSTEVCIICSIHGGFWQTPRKHLQGHGCHICANNKPMDTKEFIEKAKLIHGDRYDYSKVKYIKSNKKVCIICSIHGEFWQTPNNHLRMKGCHICANEINVKENILLNELRKHFNDIIYQYKNKKIIGNMSIDMLIPSLNVAIEYQGIQHFEPVGHFGGIKEFIKTAKRDKMKYKLCNENGIKLLYFTYDKKLPTTYIDTIYTDFNELLKEINNGKNKTF